MIRAPASAGELLRRVHADSEWAPPYSEYVYWDIDLTTEPATVRLRDTDNFRAFHVEASGPRDAIEAALSPYGRWVDGFAWFRPEAIREAAGDRAKAPTWQAGFDAMIEYARDHGYSSDDGCLRAHVEWRDDTGGA